MISLPHTFRSLLRCHLLSEAFLTIVKTVTLPLPPYYPMIPPIASPPPTPHSSSSDIHLIIIKLLILKFQKGIGARDQIANICWIIKKSKRLPEKHLLLLYWLCQNPWLCITTNRGKFFKRWEYQITWPASWEICMQVKKQQLELDMEQQTGSK